MVRATRWRFFSPAHFPRRVFPSIEQPQRLEGWEAALANRSYFLVSGNPFSHRNMLVSRIACYTAAPPRRRGSLRNLGSFGASSPRSVPGRVLCTRFDEANFNPPHFLNSCFLCKKPLINRDIFMYRGDIPFCSEDCRKEQMDMDEALEQSHSLSASMKAMRSKQNDSSSPGKSQKYHFRAGIAAA